MSDINFSLSFMYISLSLCIYGDVSTLYRESAIKSEMELISTWQTVVEQIIN